MCVYDKNNQYYTGIPSGLALKVDGKEAKTKLMSEVDKNPMISYIGNSLGKI